MNKRKLTRRQAWRIEKIQQERIERAQKKAEQQSLNTTELGDEQQGLVIAHYGSQLDVEDLSGQVHRCHLRANLSEIVTGDQVIWQLGDPTGIVTAVLPRESELCRPDSYGKLRTVAANIDTIVLVIAPLPEPFANLINRYLVAAECIDIQPLILLNKTDLLPSVDNQQVIADLMSSYQAIGYNVIQASTKLNNGLQAITDFLSQRTSVFVGQSGVGKSSLIKALLGSADKNSNDIKIGELSAATAKGRHTTTTAKLFHMPCGGQLIDSPGIREFGLWHINRDQLAYGFIEFRPFLGHCKFRDCRHQQEPDCAILNAVDNGEISEHRLASFEFIAQTLEAEDKPPTIKRID